MLAQEKVSSLFDSNLTLQDRVRLFLNDQGEREVKITIGELAEQLDKPEPSVYQVINILRQRGEIELEKESLENGREKIVGLKINKLEPSGRTYKRAAERSSGRIERIKPQLDSLVPSQEELFLPVTVEYLKKKLVIEDMKSRAISAGLSETVVTFDPDPQAEEAILLLKALTDLKTAHEQLKEEHQMQSFDLEAERRNVAALKLRLREETDTMLREG